ncbi:APC family permease [Paucibacter sp. APW11]|uniref:APC family permease n=1 Tax=Roseateles aquae TaxID=3077235 RepID=A0ABU3P6M9_9BURK|nr:APC family permease [Paucibacter sp. APW11]MDT8998232.1 APC family permease [Paucibacter sp. APW11]
MSVEQFGYQQQLKRVLGFKDLLSYGMVAMVPIAPFGVYGFVAEASQGRVPLAYLLGLLAMLFTALSYAAMAEAFPVAGSAYAYTQRGLHPLAGFFAGWLLLLDYILVPALLFVISAGSLQALLPAWPKWLWVLGFIALCTAINLRGVELTARANRLFLQLQLLVLALFMVIGLWALYQAGGPGLSLAPVSPTGLSWSWLGGAAAIAALSFLGFDAISTLSEEVREDQPRAVSRATLLVLFLMGACFIAQTWVAADLAQGLQISSPDSAFYEIAQKAGGRALFVTTAVATALAWGIANAMSAQAAVARVLFAMGRDRQLPGSRWLAAVHPVRQTPGFSTALVALVSLAVALYFLDDPAALTNLVTFGALSAFGLLHLAVSWHFLVRQRSRRWLRHGLLPLAGLAVLLFILHGQDRAAMQLGLAWLALGALWAGVQRLWLRRELKLAV